MSTFVVLELSFLRLLFFDVDCFFSLPLVEAAVVNDDDDDIDDEDGKLFDDEATISSCELAGRCVSERANCNVDGDAGTMLSERNVPSS